MKKTVAFLTLLTLTLTLAAGSALASGGVSDNFDDGFQQTWTWISDGTYTAAVVNNELSLTAPFPPSPGGNFVGGSVGATATLTDTFLQGTVNTDPTKGDNDQGLMCRVQGDNSFYGINYDPYNGHVELIYNGATGFANLARVADVTSPLDQTVNLKLNVLDSGSEVHLVGQAWNSDWSAMLGENQVIVDGIVQFESVTVPVLGAGPAGLYGALNGNQTVPDALDIRIDDWSARVGLAGDVNLDGLVNSTDYTIWANGYDTGSTWSVGDLNLDGDVDSTDYTVWANNYGGTAAPPPMGDGVPEPATMSLLGVGALALLRRRRR